jgi:glutamate-1-semialdehyde 2,1-aminomutase
MAANGWWWHAPGTTNKSVRRSILRELIAKRLGR